MTNFKKNITLAVLRELTEDDKVFARGEALFAGGKVKDLSIDRDGITATVAGEEKYLVELFAEEDDALGGSCTCAAGELGDFCEHQVATGIAFLDSRKGSNAYEWEDDDADDDDGDEEGTQGSSEDAELLEQDELVHAVTSPSERARPRKSTFNWKAFLNKQSREQLVSMLVLLGQQYPEIIDAYSLAEGKDKP